LTKWWGYLFSERVFLLGIITKGKEIAEVGDSLVIAKFVA